MHIFSKRSLDNMRTLHPYLTTILTVALRTSTIDFTITSGGRTAEEQNMIYQKGRTQAGKIVTKADGYSKVSNHQIKSDNFSYAVDLYPYVNGSIDVMDKGRNLDKLAQHIQGVAKNLGFQIIWGGNWPYLVDKGHFELKL